MKKTPPINPILVSDLQPARLLRPWFKPMASLALAAAALLTATNSPAAQLTWDAGNTANGATIDAASGAWNTDTTTNVNWNNVGVNASWAQTSPTVALNGATFAGTDGAAGTYQVALDGPQIALNNLTISANGYAFSGAAAYLISGAILSVADGKNVTFNNLMTGPNNAINWRLGAAGAPATMALLGNFTVGQFAVGSTNGSTLWLGGPGTSSGGVFTINANVIHTNGTWANTATWQVGRPGASTQADAGKTAFPGIYTMDGGSAILNLTAQMQISRNGGNGKVIVKNGAVNLTAASANSTVEVLKDGTIGGLGSFSMEGGSMNVGNASFAGTIGLAKFGAGTNSQAIFSQSGGTIKAWGGIIIGAASGTFATNSVAAFTNSGGFLYVGNVGGVGISRGVASPATNYFVFSGGTVGALQSWISATPLTLATLNGNITFQCADDSATPFNIGLSGALTGPGGLYKTGGGTLTLSGANNYTGSTVVSNGVLKIVPSASPTNGLLTLDGSAGSPTLSVAPTSAGQFVTVNGNLTYAAGTVTANFDFGALPPSSSVAPILVANNVACTVTPDITIVGSAIPVGTYPLIKYGGSVSGTLPAAPTVLPASTTGYITNITSTKTIALVVTASPVSASLTWRVGNGNWGLSLVAQNWTLFGSPVVYTEPNSVQLDDTATGPFPVTISNVTAVNPNAITVLGTNAWTISGNAGSIGGGASLTKAGSGTLTLSGTNSYSGGTTVSGGQLNINNGGNSAANSAIGTGPLTLGLNAKVDNTSGQSVTLQPTIAQSWQDDWTYVGSTNLNTGSGAVTLGSSVVVLTVSNSVLEVGGAISDVGNAYKLQKAGSGTLTLGVDNNFSGGVQLDSGLLRLKSAGGLGTGGFTIGSASIDNLSGADMAVTGISGITFSGNNTISYLGTSNSLDLGAVAAVLSGGPPMQVNVVSNSLTFSGNFTSGNSLITKTGQGTLVLAGSGVSQFVGNVNEGELHLAHGFGPAIGTGDSGNGILVQSNAVLKITGASLNQIPNAADTRLSSGGVFDVNGIAEEIGLLRMTNGVVRNGLAASSTILTIANANGAILRSTNNVFDVPDAAASLTIAGNVTGTGSLVKSGAGAVTVQGTNTYTGNTTVSNGTLTISFPLLASTSTVRVNPTGVLNLNFAGGETNTVAALILGGVSKPAGVYNATTDSTYLAGTGNIRVVPPVLINPLPGTILTSVSGSTLALSWPTNAGWILQAQTNTLNVGLVSSTNAWFNVSGSELVTSTNMTINPANGTVFYRMVLP